MPKVKKKFKLNAYCLLFCVIVLCALASYVITPGVFERQIVNGRTMVIPGSYHTIEKTALSPFAVFDAIPNGIIGAANMIALILLVGGTIEVYNKSGAINSGINKLVYAVGDKGGPFVITALFYAFAILGGFLGWVEVCIPFAPLVIPIFIALGYDAIVATGVIILGLLVGFAIGPTNLYTVGIAHQVSQLPMFSGIGLRLVAYVVFTGISLIYLLAYAKKIKSNPEKSYMKGISDSEISIETTDNPTITKKQILALIVLLITFIFAIYGMLKLKWSIINLTGAFILSGIIVGYITGMTGGEIADNFLEGTKNAMGGAMLVGVARGVQWILEQGEIIDPIINWLANLLDGLPPVASAIGIFVVVTFLNALVPSGSGKAMALMPILIPLSELIGITRQTMTLAYQFGDGISNMFWFTSGGLLIFLSFGKVPLQRWYKFFIPLMSIMIIFVVIFLTIAVKIGYGPA